MAVKDAPHENHAFTRASVPSRSELWTFNLPWASLYRAWALSRSSRTRGETSEVVGGRPRRRAGDTRLVLFANQWAGGVLRPAPDSVEPLCGLSAPFPTLFRGSVNQQNAVGTAERWLRTSGTRRGRAVPAQNTGTGGLSLSEDESSSGARMGRSTCERRPNAPDVSLSPLTLRPSTSKRHSVWATGISISLFEAFGLMAGGERCVITSHSRRAIQAPPEWLVLCANHPPPGHRRVKDTGNRGSGGQWSQCPPGSQGFARGSDPRRSRAIPLHKGSSGSIEIIRL